MKKIAVYISISLFVGNFAFSAERGTLSTNIFNDSFSLFGGQNLINDDSENVVLRKRAHKRKRKVRPRRNGF